MRSLASAIGACVCTAMILVACASRYRVTGVDADGGSDGAASTDATLTLDAPANDASEALDADAILDAGAKPDCSEADAGLIACVVDGVYQCVNPMNDANNCGACGRICNPTITLACADGDCARTVFISSAFYPGNLGGTAGADAKCTSLANAAGLHGKFAAWLSTSTTSVGDRFVQSTRPYYLLDNTLIANGYEDLVTTGHPAVAINVTEKAQVISTHDADAGGSGTNENYAHVWSNTDDAAKTTQTSLLDDCGDFSTTADHARWGDATSDLATEWTAAYVEDNGTPEAVYDTCTELNRLYCFEQ